MTDVDEGPDDCQLCGEIVTFCQCEQPITDIYEARDHYRDLARYWKARWIIDRARPTEADDD